MNLEILYRSQQAEPFQPFVVFLADGRTLVLENPELLMLADDGRSISLFDPPDTLHLIDPELIVSLQFREPLPAQVT